MRDDEDDNLTDTERRALQRALVRAYQQAPQGRTRPATDVLAELRARR